MSATENTVQVPLMLIIYEFRLIGNQSEQSAFIYINISIRQSGGVGGNRGNQ